MRHHAPAFGGHGARRWPPERDAAAGSPVRGGIFVAVRFIRHRSPVGATSTGIGRSYGACAYSLVNESTKMSRLRRCRLDTRSAPRATGRGDGNQGAMPTVAA